MKIKPGSITAIVGPTGSGKSSILRVLLRHYNIQNGNYFLDGHDVNTLSTSSIRNLFSVVPQNPVWLEKTLLENLVYGCDRTIEKDEVIELCKSIGIYERIEKLPKGIDTPISIEGAPFSSGQQQCLAIVRALLKNSPILILDEPTSAIDAMTESKILNYLHRLQKKKTMIVVAHRLSTILSADQVIVIRNGNITESGSPKDLIQKRGYFYQLWETQGKFWTKPNLQYSDQPPHTQNLPNP